MPGRLSHSVILVVTLVLLSGCRSLFSSPLSKNAKYSLSSCSAEDNKCHSVVTHQRSTRRSKFNRFLNQKNVVLVAQSQDDVSVPNSISSKYFSTKAPHKLSVQQSIYVVLTSIFVTCLIIADVIGVKIFELQLPFQIFGFKSVEHTCGMLTFPITFLLGDIINEYYGAKATKATVYIGLAMSILVFGVMNLAQALPYLDKPFNVSPFAFNSVFGTAKLMYVASISAYVVGQLIDIWLFGLIKRVTKGKYLWLRATGSTLISQFLDSFVVSYIAFSLGKTLTNQVPATLAEVSNIAVTGYALKFVISAAITPILYVIRNFLHDKFGFEALPVDYVEED